MERDRRFAVLSEAAAHNGGWATVEMARRAGIPPSTFYRVAARHAWPRIQVSTFALPGAALTWRAHLDAALQAAGAPSAATGLAALVLHGLEVDDEPAPLQLVVPAARTALRLRSPVRLLRTSCMTRYDVQDVGGRPVVRAGWALLHHAGAVRPASIVGIGLAARQAGLLDVAALDDVLSRAGTAPGVAALRALRRELRDHQPDSLLELRWRRLLGDHGLRPWPRPFPFRCPDRRVVHLDIAFPQAWVALEVDGRRAHGPLDVERDRRRSAQAQRGGWQIIRVTAADLRRDPMVVVDRVRAAVVDADPARPAATATPCARGRCTVCRR